MVETKGKYMRVTEIMAATGVERNVVYSFLSRNKIPRYRRQGEHGILVDVEAYVAALERTGYREEARALRARMMAS